jgi:RNA polymerase sigma-70 factor (ECF subfamily)
MRRQRHAIYSPPSWLGAGFGILMGMAEGETTQLGLLLQRAGEGERAAVEALLRHTGERLTLLARRMLGRFPRVRRWAQTDDVLQNALMRLVAALRDVKPRSTRDFLALANVQVRRELIDLARHYYGPHGIGANQDTDGAQNALLFQAGDGEDPAALVQWGELHQQIGALPEEEREVMELVFYQGMSQAEAAELLAVSVRTVQRRWHAALLKLHRYVGRDPGPTP